MNYEQLADLEYATNVGRDNPTRAWILSDRDVWYRNPFYRGEPVPHPEDEQHWQNVADAEEYAEEYAAECAPQVEQRLQDVADEYDDDIPF